MRLVRKKIVLQFVASNLATIANFALIIILSRLLTPTDIGIFSMSAVLIAVAHVFRDFGVTAYIKRVKELDENTLRSAIGVLFTTSWAMAAAMFLSAGLWAHFFDEPRVASVVRVLALGFVFIPFGAIPQAIFARNFEVEKFAIITAVSTIVYFLVSILLAYQGFGHMTMAWANLANILVSAIAAYWLLEQPLPWKPRMKGWEHMVHFGTGTIITSILKAMDTALPDLILGKLSNPAAVGLFSRANSTANMPSMALNPTISYFSLPYLAKIHHSNGKLNLEYLRATSIINTILLPILVYIAIMAKDIVLFLYGQQWYESVDAVPWICLACAVVSIFILTTPALASIGKPYAAISPLLLTLLAKISIIFMLYDGTLASFAWAIAIGQCASIPLYMRINRLFLHIEIRAWVIVVSKLCALTLITGLTCHIVAINLPEQFSSLLRILITGVSLLLSSAASIWILNLPMKQEVLQSILQMKKPSRAM